MKVKHLGSSPQPQKHRSALQAVTVITLVTVADFPWGMVRAGACRRNEGGPQTPAPPFQWGWGGYTTHDLARCRLAARLLGLFYNWWNIFVRLADPRRLRRVRFSAILCGWAALALRAGQPTLAPKVVDQRPGIRPGRP